MHTRFTKIPLPFISAPTGAVILISYKAAINHTTENWCRPFPNQSGTQVIKDTDLSSAYNDKCPFILDNLMVFTSDRPGGFGGLICTIRFIRMANGRPRLISAARSIRLQMNTGPLLSM